MQYELVKVIDRARLLNPEQLEHRYKTKSGRTLARGIHAVLWPEAAPTRRYDTNARYYGPFLSWRAASDFVRCALDARGERSWDETGV